MLAPAQSFVHTHFLAMAARCGVNNPPCPENKTLRPINHWSFIKEL